MRKTQVQINPEKLELSSEVLRALAHPLRLKLLAFIDRNQTTNVNSIYSALQLEQSITSQHLRVLRQAGLVDAKRRGKFIYYCIDYDKLKFTSEALQAFFAQSGLSDIDLESSADD